jgi:hypothetical protein
MSYALFFPFQQKYFRKQKGVALKTAKARF